MSKTLTRLERMLISTDDERKRYRRRRGPRRLFQSSLDAGIARRLQAGSSDGYADAETARDYVENACGNRSSSGEDMEVTRKLSSLNVGLDGGYRRLSGHLDGGLSERMTGVSPIGVLSDSEAIGGCVSWKAARKKRRRYRNVKGVGERSRQKRKLPVSERPVADGTARKWKRVSPLVTSRFDPTGFYVQDDPDVSVLERYNPGSSTLARSVSTSSTVTHLSPDTETSSSGTFPKLTEEAIARFACRFQVNMSTSSSKPQKKATRVKHLSQDQANSSGDDSVFVNPPSPQPELSASSTGTSCPSSNVVLVENESLMLSSAEENDEMSDESVDRDVSCSSSSLSDPEQTADERGRDGDDEESSFEHSVRVIPWWDKGTNTTVSSEEDEDVDIGNLMDSAWSLLRSEPQLSSTSSFPRARHMQVSQESVLWKKGRSLSPPCKSPLCSSLTRPLPRSNIGSQMLRSMGWLPGCGLGAHRNGILEPVMPVRRPKGRGLGYS